MKNYRAILLFMAGIFLVCNGMGQSLRIDQDGMAILNGKRTFMLGMYENPAEDEILKQVADAGFKIIATNFKDSATTRKNLDRLATLHLGAWITGNFDLGHNIEKTRHKLQQMVASYGKHPALLAWEVPDEALWNVTTKAWEYRVNAEIKQLNELNSKTGDSVKRRATERRINVIRPLYYEADYREGQAIADSLMNAFGKMAAGPEYDLTATKKAASEMAAGLKSGYDFMKSIDPVHPVFMNHAPRNQVQQLTSYNQAADIIGCDIYPVPEFKIEHSDLADHSLSCVGEYTRRMKESAQGKPVWMVLQGFGWGDYFTFETPEKRKELRRPTPEESRFMAYDAIVNGAKGICYWGTYGIEKDSQLWKELMQLAGELNSLQPVLSSPDSKLNINVSVDETFNSFDRQVRVLPKQAGKEIHFIVVNENKNRNPVFCSIKNIRELNGLTYADLLSGKKYRVENGELRFPITGQAVRVLRPLEN